MPPVRTSTLTSNSPSPVPTTVTDTPPVVAPFVLATLLAPTSAVMLDPSVPASRGDVTATDTTPATADVRPRTLLSDDHSVASAPVVPTRIALLQLLICVPRPTTVTLTDPVPAVFDFSVPLASGPS